ncbi:hypothetical protein [Streptomyces cadmiisoli]|uniref:Uncharacterized protein n=1 Tax=Streptomyces cadmiisoli TaxID=2184053 RepID=A0A2Z4JEU6_9ACTN|nr:hypothetical protein [Streptomyces cadmiisoli]AWW43053.1 hypothetical protein DN051_41205 [Streptomyces cadmiisoli]
MIDPNLLYYAVLERWESAPQEEYGHWWTFSQFLCESDLRDCAQYFTDFTAERPDIHAWPEGVPAEEYRLYVVGHFIEWFTARQTAEYEQYGQYAAYARGGEYAQDPQYANGEYGYAQDGAGGYGEQGQYAQGGEYAQDANGQYTQGEAYAQSDGYDQGDAYAPYAEGAYYPQDLEQPQEQPAAEDEGREPPTDPEEEVRRLLEALAAFTGSVEDGAQLTADHIAVLESYEISLEEVAAS